MIIISVEASISIRTLFLTQEVPTNPSKIPNKGIPDFLKPIQKMLQSVGTKILHFFMQLIVKIIMKGLFFLLTHIEKCG